MLSGWLRIDAGVLWESHTSTFGHVTPLDSIGAIDIAIVLLNAVFMMLRDTLSLSLLGCSAILQCYEVQRFPPSPLHHSSVL
jgi:hypothetical protein